MITKGNLRKLKSVGVSVWGANGQKFSNGQASRTMRVYDTTPDEVIKVIEKALESQ